MFFGLNKPDPVLADVKHRVEFTHENVSKYSDIRVLFLLHFLDQKIAVLVVCLVYINVVLRLNGEELVVDLEVQDGEDI